MSDGPEQVYKPAKRAGIGWLILLAGPADSGKTFSALRLATGLAGQDGKICFADTEHGRALFYADDFRFFHHGIVDPFRPEKFRDAAVIAQKEKAALWICDNFSWEHIGPGGLLDWHEAELQRIAGDDFAKREKAKFTAWIKPKAAHTQMLHRFWQLNSHIILCVQAKEKMDLEAKDEKTGKMKPKSLGLQPICGEDLPYAMTASFMLDPANRGVPKPIKLMGKHEHLFQLDRPLDEATGERIAAWARGEKTQPPPTSPPANGQQGLPLGNGSDKAIQVAEELEALFLGTASMVDHFAIADDPKRREQIAWLKKHRPELHKRVDQALRASAHRNDAQQKVT